MARHLFCLIFVLLILGMAPGAIASTFSPGDRPEQISVGIIYFDDNRVFGEEFYQALSEAMQGEVADYYDADLRFDMWEEDPEEYLNQVDRDGEQFLFDYFSSREIDVLLVNELSRDGQQVSFKAFQEEGMFDVFYLPYNLRILPSLVELSVGHYLSLIEGLDKRLFVNRNY